MPLKVDANLRPWAALRALSSEMDDIAELFSILEDEGFEVATRYGTGADAFPDPSGMCPGPCEGMGCVPIDCGILDPAALEEYLKDAPKDFALISYDQDHVDKYRDAWVQAEAESPSDDGWHFLKCPDCHGTGKRKEPKEVVGEAVGEALALAMVDNPKWVMPSTEAGEIVDRAAAQISAFRAGRKTLVFDFDGTIAEEREFPEIGPPILETIERMHAARDAGIEVVIQSCRWSEHDLSTVESAAENMVKVKAWLDEHEVPYDRLVAGKPLAEMYVDDKACHVNDLQNLDRMIVELASEHPVDGSFKGIIYKATCIPTGKCYVGLTTQTLKDRIFRHLQAAKRGQPDYFKNAIRAHGAEAFRWDVLGEYYSKEDLVAAEIKAIVVHGAFHESGGYNLTHGGEGAFGRIPSDLVRARVAEANRKRVWSEEDRARMSRLKAGIPHSAQHNKKVSAALKGRPKLEEQKKKQSDAMIARYAKLRASRVLAFGDEHEYGCLMLEMPKELADEVLAWGRENIPDADLFIDPENPKDNGRETQIHTTVSYGIDPATDPGDVQFAIFQQRKPVKVKLGAISKFDKDDCDVIKVEVVSPDMVRMHKEIEENIGTPGNTFPDYKPHVTIAYVKKGAADKLIGEDPFAGREFELTEFDYGYPPAPGEKDVHKHYDLNNIRTAASVMAHVRKHGDKWVVTNKAGDKTLGTHDTEEGAKKQLAAIEIHKHAGSMSDDFARAGKKNFDALCEMFPEMRKAADRRQAVRSFIRQAAHTDSELKAFLEGCPEAESQGDILGSYRSYKEAEVGSAQLWNVDGSYAAVVGGKYVDLCGTTLESMRFFDRLATYSNGRAGIPVQAAMIEADKFTDLRKAALRLIEDDPSWKQLIKNPASAQAYGELEKAVQSARSEDELRAAWEANMDLPWEAVTAEAGGRKK